MPWSTWPPLDVEVVETVPGVDEPLSAFPPAAGPDPFAVLPSLTPTIGAVARSTRDITRFESDAPEDATDALTAAGSGVETRCDAAVTPLTTRRDPALIPLRAPLEPVPTPLTTTRREPSSPPMSLSRSSSPVRGAFQRATAAPVSPPRTEPTTNAPLCR